MQRALHFLGKGFGPLHRRSSCSLLLQIPRLSRARGCRSTFRHRQIRLCLSDSKVHMSANPNSDADAPSAVAPHHLAYKPKVGYCQSCGGPTNQIIPDGEEKLRAVCSICGKIHYDNPKMVVGCLVEQDGKVLLCRRNIEPSYGLWTLPAGYLEIGESASEGAIRETLEEACADVEVVSPFAHLDIPCIGQYRVTSFFEQD